MTSENIKSLMSAKDLDKYLAKLSFEEASDLLNDLVQNIEAGKLALADAMLAYERAAALLSHLRSLLSQAEEKMTVINKEKIN